MRWNRHTVMLCQHLFIACQLRWTKKKKTVGDLKKVLAKISIVRWHISLVKLELETVQSISVIICLGTPSIFPDPTLIIVFVLA